MIIFTLKKRAQSGPKKATVFFLLLTGNVKDAAKTARPIPASSHSSEGMSVGSRIIQLPISHPAPQPSPCEPSPTAEAVVPEEKKTAVLF